MQEGLRKMYKITVNNNVSDISLIHAEGKTVPPVENVKAICRMDQGVKVTVKDADTPKNMPQGA